MTLKKFLLVCGGTAVFLVCAIGAFAPSVYAERVVRETQAAFRSGGVSEARAFCRGRSPLSEGGFYFNCEVDEAGNPPIPLVTVKGYWNYVAAATLRETNRSADVVQVAEALTVR